MATKPKQKMRFEGDELSLIKNTFGDNDAVLLALRKVFFQVKLETAEMELLKPVTQNEAVKALLRKTYAPEIELDAPFGQVIDLWMTVDSKDKTPMELKLTAQVRERLLELLNAGLERLTDLGAPITEKVFDYKPDFSMDDEKFYVEMMARNGLISHTEVQLNQLKALGMNKDETPEQTAQRLARNSSK